MKRNSSQAKEVHSVLKKTGILPQALAEWLKGTSQEMECEMFPLRQCMERNAPQSLFRIRRFTDNTVDALKNDMLFLSRADYFNDPFDCLLYFDRDKLKESVESKTSETNLQRYLRTMEIQYPVNETIKTESALLQLFRDSKPKFLKDVEQNFSEITDELQKGTYIACLGETVKSPVMWSHYSDNHKGFAIEYQFEQEFFCPKPHFLINDEFDAWGWRSLLPVYYSKYRADGTYLAEWYCLCEMRKKYSMVNKQENVSFFLPDMLLKTKLSLEKAEAWAYEREWRLILTHEWPNDIGSPRVHIQKKAAGIYLGSRIEECNKLQLIHIAKEKGIPVYEMYIDHSSREYEMSWRQVL